MIILQISPEFEAGTGVGSVVHNLEEQWRLRGHDVRRFGPTEAGCTRWARPSSGLAGRVRHISQVVWFSTVGTVRARRAVADLPAGAIAICHNDALAGDIYVNHGVLRTAMRARGHYWWRMVRNPLHLFTATRDRRRYLAGVHRVVVNLTHEDDTALHREFPRLQMPTVVIGNGVDTTRFRPPSDEERRVCRAGLDLNDDTILTVFVGNEYERKGLFGLMDAVAGSSPRHHLLVVGGTADMIAHAQDFANRRGMGDRFQPVGRQDPLPYLWAADLLAQPSAYESYGLVVTEALAAGVPVISTHVGVAPDVIDDGVNGYLTDGSSEDLGNILERFESADHMHMRSAARQSSLGHDWETVSNRYLELFESLVTDTRKIL